MLLTLYKALRTFLRRTIGNGKNILNYCYTNISFALLNGWNVIEISFDHAWAGKEECCLWAPESGYYTM
jgi:hypothetical protein